MTSGTHRASMSIEPSTACSASTEWGSCLSSSSSSSIGTTTHPPFLKIRNEELEIEVRALRAD